MELWIDNKRIRNPTEEDVASGFNSITGKGASSAGMSIVQLIRDDRSQIMISGHPADGWLMPEIEENGRQFVCLHKDPLPQDAAIELFQNYLRGNNSWKERLSWKESTVSNSTSIKHVAILLIAAGALVYFLRKTLWTL